MNLKNRAELNRVTVAFCQKFNEQAAVFASHVKLNPSSDGTFEAKLMTRDVLLDGSRYFRGEADIYLSVGFYDLIAQVCKSMGVGVQWNNRQTTGWLKEPKL